MERRFLGMWRRTLVVVVEVVVVEVVVVVVVVEVVVAEVGRLGLES